MNTFAVSFRLLRIRSIAFCCFSNGSFRFSAGLRHFFFDRFEFLHLASFLICFCFFEFCFCFSVAFGFLDFARFRFLQLLFWSFKVLSFSTQMLPASGDALFPFLRFYPVLPFSIPERLLKSNCCLFRMPSLWKILHLWLVFLCVILCRHVFSFLFSFVLHKETILLTHYLHSSHLELSLRRFSLRVGSFFFVPLL